MFRLIAMSDEARERFRLNSYLDLLNRIIGKCLVPGLPFKSGSVYVGFTPNFVAYLGGSLNMNLPGSTNGTRGGEVEEV